MEIKFDKRKFLINWILLNVTFFIIGYILMIIFAIFMMWVTNISFSEWPSPFEQFIWSIGNGILLGSSIGFIQWRLLKSTYHIALSWIYLVPVGIIITEIVLGIILLEMGGNRGELVFWEGEHLSHAMIATMYGLMIGLFQFPILKKQFSRSTFWVIASTLAWGVSIGITALPITDKNDVFFVIKPIVGIILYGVITGVTLQMILKPKI